MKGKVQKVKAVEHFRLSFEIFKSWWKFKGSKGWEVGVEQPNDM